MSTVFRPQEKVILARVRHDNFRGKTGTVKRFIKSRQVVRVAIDGSGVTYDAKPENLDLAK